MKKYRENKITVYTPTYNRGYCLHQLFESLCRQTQSSDDFEWLIVDDGSRDNTKELVEEWMKQAPFKINYHKQQNEGKMAKLNFIHQIIDTELCTCVDSDDFLTDSALEIILNKWKRIENKTKIAGIVGLDIYKNGNVVGTAFPENLKEIKFQDFGKNRVQGDKKFIYRSDIISAYPPYPSINGEKFPAPGYLYRLIDVDYDLVIINEPLCVVEYMEDGLSKNKYSQFKNRPNSFMFYRQERMRLATTFSERFKNTVHYISSCIFAKKSIFKNNNFPVITFFAIPFGLLLNLYIKKTNKKGRV